jgi:hypothetical protein
MKQGHTPSSRFVSGIGLWMAVVLSVLTLNAGVSFLQMRFNVAEQPGLGASVGYFPDFAAFCSLR